MSQCIVIKRKNSYGNWIKIYKWNLNHAFKPSHLKQMWLMDSLFNLTHNSIGIAECWCTCSMDDVMW
jgi:hypothetical protein